MVLGYSNIIRQSIIMEQILRYSRSLSLPVKPQSSCAVMNVILSYHYIDRSMHFYSTDLSSRKIVSVVDVMDLVLLNKAEHSAEMPDNTGLPAIMNIASPDNMRSDVLFRPAFDLRLTDIVPLCLCPILIFPAQPFVIIIWLSVFSE